jgi:transcriptional regulator GlxA family with amidase domain
MRVVGCLRDPPGGFANISIATSASTSASRCWPKVADLSVCYFVRAFKQTMGITPHEYLMRQRVELAMSLLAETDMPLSEIAVTAGFVDQSHCSRRFRQRVGMSPRDYRHRRS